MGEVSENQKAGKVRKASGGSKKARVLNREEVKRRKVNLSRNRIERFGNLSERNLNSPVSIRPPSIRCHRIA